MTTSSLNRNRIGKLFSNMKSGARIATPYIISLYFISIAADMITTYIASPDLKYEGNIYVRYFDLGWSQIIIFGALHALFVCSLFLVALNYIHAYYGEHQDSSRGFISEIFQNKKLLLSFFIFGYFYKHLINSVLISLNNYLAYTYLFKVENSLSRIFKWYINLQLKFSATTFLVSLEVFFFLVALILTIYLGIKIRNKYRTQAV